MQLWDVERVSGRLRNLHGSRHKVVLCSSGGDSEAHLFRLVQWGKGRVDFLEQPSSRMNVLLNLLPALTNPRLYDDAQSKAPEPDTRRTQRRGVTGRPHPQVSTNLRTKTSVEEELGSLNTQDVRDGPTFEELAKQTDRITLPPSRSQSWRPTSASAVSSDLSPAAPCAP